MDPQLSRLVRCYNMSTKLYGSSRSRVEYKINLNIHGPPLWSLQQLGRMPTIFISYNNIGAYIILFPLFKRHLRLLERRPNTYNTHYNNVKIFRLNTYNNQC